MAEAHDNPTSPPATSGLPLAAFEIAWIFLVFFLFAGALPPDVGESHYLVKAKHYWQPEWCAGDLFLESRDAHATFNWVFGWVTRFSSLAATAWIGRAVIWLLLAWSWRRLSWAVVPRPLVSLLSAGLMLALLRHGHLAGEWIVGGVEAKGFAYVLVFLALEGVARGRWRAALLFAGAAGAFHVLVGGWTAMAIGFAWLIAGRERMPLAKIIPAAALGLMLALPGLVPAIRLNAGVPSELSREAARIYVFERLAHHLVYSEFAAWNVARFQMLVVLCGALAWYTRNDLGVARLQRVVAGTVAIAVIGVAIDQVFVWRANWLDQSALDYQLAAAGLLRYYWFRMSDSLVPIGVALGIVAALERVRVWRPAVAAWLQAVAILVAGVNLGEVFYSRAQQPFPPAIVQPLPDGTTVSAAWFRDWVSVCAWAAANTPPDAIFLTPRGQQTFKWYAGRAEVVSWKDVPQDAAGLIEWKKRLAEVHPRDRAHHECDLAAFSDVQLVALAKKYNAAYIVIDRARSRRRIGLRKVYPIAAEENGSFDIYRVGEVGP
jgi:hypothetical protein